MATLEEKRLAEIATGRQFVTPDQVTEVAHFVEQSAAEGKQVSMADTFVQRGYITEMQKQVLLKAVADSGPLKIGDFEIIGELGRGGMGAVYKAREVSMDRVCALKLLPAHLAADAGLVTRFRREAQACARLDHPNIVRAYRVGEAEGQHFFAMELIDGTSVERMLETSGALPIEQAVGIVKQIARALSHAHKAGMIHRDIKPANVLITRGGVAKLADLGLVRQTEGDLTRLTQSGTGMGTPAYMPPEQIRGAKLADARSDIYALGATLYHMLVGVEPYQGDSSFEVMRQHEEGRLKPPRSLRPEVPSWLELVVLKMMQRKPENRFQSAEELLEALERGAPPVPAAGTVAAKAAPDRSWHLQIKQKDGAVRKVRVEGPALRRMMAEGKLPLTTLARKGQEGALRPLSEYSELMEAAATTKARSEKRGDPQLKEFYRQAETAAARRRTLARVKRIVLLVLKIGIVIAVLVGAYVYRSQIIELVRRLVKK